MKFRLEALYRKNSATTFFSFRLVRMLQVFALYLHSGFDRVVAFSLMFDNGKWDLCFEFVLCMCNMVCISY